MDNETGSGYASFVKVAAVCSMIGALTTLVLVLLEPPAAKGFEASVSLHTNKIYMSQLWIFFFHPQLNVMAGLGIAVLLYRKRPALVIPGLLFLMIWGITESAQKAFTIDAVNQYWRAQYSVETDPTLKSIYHGQLIGSEAISDSMYFLLLYCFGVGATLLGCSLLRESRLARATGAASIFFGVLSICAFLRWYAGATIFSTPIEFSFRWIYPVLQPAARFALGIWLWQQSGSTQSTPLS